MTCQIDSADEGEIVDFERHATVKARKDHKCGECRDVIKIGELYETSAQLYDGSFSTFRTCLLCVEIRDKIFCSWIYGMMWDDLAEENVFTISLEGLSGPAIEKIEKFWRLGQDSSKRITADE